MNLPASWTESGIVNDESELMALHFEAMTNTDGQATLTMQAYSKLRAHIISGQLAPGQRLKVEVLRDQLSVGATPIREALSLLTSEGLVQRLDKRGFRVSDVSLEEYDDLHATRCMLEAHALRESIAHGDEAWEDRIVLVTHRLRRLPRMLENEAGTRSNPEWERMHKLFHMALLAASPSRTILQFCDQLHDRINRYRSVAAIGASGQRDWQGEHNALAEAVIDRNADVAAEELLQHYARTTAILRATLSDQSVGGQGAA